MKYEDINELANLISIRNYIDLNINSSTIKKEQVNSLQKLIGKIDNKIIETLLSSDFLTNLK